MFTSRLSFSLGCLVLCATLAYGQGATDFSKVEIKTTRIADNFHTLEGQGGTIGVLSGPDGVFMVDTQFAPLSDKIAAAIKQITPHPIKFVVNTHLHGDHTGGDTNFAKMGATIISREELRFRLAHPNPQASGAPGTPMPAIGLPRQTYREREDDVVAAKVTADLDAKVQQPGTTGERFVRQAYADLKATR